MLTKKQIENVWTFFVHFGIYENHKGFVSTYKKCLKVCNFIFVMLLLHTFEHLNK